MKYMPLSELRPSDLVEIEPTRPSNLRRQRLERLAAILDGYMGRIRLFAQIEAVPRRRRMAMQLDLSPFAIAFADGEFRADGLESDAIGDASRFFGLSSLETHELVCDCHYFGPVSAKTVAERARYLARHPGLMTRLRDIVSYIRS